MPKISPFLQEVIAVVSDFLKTIKQNELAQKLLSQYPAPEWVKKKNPLLKKGLKKILKEYINSDEQMIQYYSDRKQPQELNQNKKRSKVASPSKTPIQSPKNILRKQQKKPSGWMSKFQQPKRLQDLNEFDDLAISEEVDIPKKDKKKQKKKLKTKQKQLQSSQMESEQQFKLQKKELKKSKKLKQNKKQSSQEQSQSQSEKIVKKNQKNNQKSKDAASTKLQKSKEKLQSKQIKQQKVQEKITTEKQKQKVNSTLCQNVQSVNNAQSTSQNGYKRFFSRINKDEVGPIPDQLRDNSFHAKAKYGGGDVWGQYGYEKLKDTRGDSFKKTKGKLKNKAFQGTGIDINRVNSIPIL